MMDLNGIQLKQMWSTIFIISFICPGILSDFDKIFSSRSQNQFNSPMKSHFATKNNTKVTVQKGGLAILPCAVKTNSLATVSWIRRKDFQLLTVGLSTYSSDGRFLVEHTRHTGQWSLRIKSVREEDHGVYECQLSVYPTQSIFVELEIIEAMAEINGAPDLHIDEGSTLRLECKIKQATESPSYVFWYHDYRMVNYDYQDGFSVLSFTNAPIDLNSNLENGSIGISDDNLLHLTTIFTISPKSHSLSSSPSLPLSSITASVLIIREVHFRHAGNYTCAPANTRPASVTVHVLKGEKPAAMQHANRSSIIENNSRSISSSLHFISNKKFYCNYQHQKSVWLFTLLQLLICLCHKINR